MRLCNDANAILTQSQYAGAYTITIAGRYRWEGLGGQGMDCEWLAGLVSRVYTWTVRMGGAGRSGAGL